MRPTTGRAALLLAAVLTLLSTGVASAATDPPTASCADEIVDGAGVLSPADVAMLTQGSTALAATTTLRLRTVTSVPKKDLNAYEKTLQISCGWATAANVRQAKLLVVMVDTQDRQMGIYPGPSLATTITKPIWLSIEQHNMRPRLASADWEGGLQEGVSALNVFVNGAAAAATAQPVTTAAHASANSHKTNWAEMSWWIGVIVLWAVVGLVGRTRKRRRWKQSSAYLYDNIPYNSGHHHGGWGGGGGGSDGGGGGSSSDGGGGSSGF